MPTPAAAATDWLSLRTMNMAHQGGEDEAPSATMYAFERSMILGADMLEVDVHTSADGQVMVLHDAAVDRTTNGSGEVYDMTAAEIQKLDAAHNFVPGVGTTSDAPKSSYAFRGVRTGDRKPPKGFKPNDFRVPTLVEVMEAYPDVPINIEIKGRGDDDRASFLANAEALAATLTDIGRTDGIIVASFSDEAINYFHELMPDIGLAPAIAETAAFKLGGVAPPEGRVAFQVPITFSGIQVTDAAFVEDAHAAGLAVHVWLSSDPENDDTYNQLLDWGVDAVMPAAPAAFERVLCERDIDRPPRPRDWPGEHCNHDRVSIACDVEPTRVSRVNRKGRVRVHLRRNDDFEGGCAGELRVRAAGKTKLARFDYGRTPPKDKADRKRSVKLKLSKKVRRALADGPRRAKVSTRAYHAFGHAKRFGLKAG
ncbi:MAG TPA: glycerophosphodiester phosphodiesterase [Thermoleophilaceae bacterium]|nr:glycerophosphodiester phosphodiesterase [Thermoleophilaceae bacterium]